jgi:hypothetical protein
MMSLKAQTRVLFPFAHPHQLIRERAGGDYSTGGEMALPHTVECLEALRRTTLFIGKCVCPTIGWPGGDSPFSRKQAKAPRQLQRDFLPVAVQAIRQRGQDREARSRCAIASE